MSLPEISRRCLACGAPVRAGARFCPHCGKRFVEDGAGGEGGRPAETRETAAPARETLKPPREMAAPAREDAAPTREAAAPQTFETAAPTQAFEAAAPAKPFETAAPPQPLAGPAAEPTPPDSGEAGRGRRAAARVKESVKESVIPRVEKMRDEALVALEETPDDSGLRFVLIAVVLFGLFLLFFFLSTTVLR
jgi:uncharacterized Zn finger protein (UPF0148 family)